MADRELFPIDGNSLVYRAFFALPESIATSDGRPTNAVAAFRYSGMGVLLGWAGVFRSYGLC